MFFQFLAQPSVFPWLGLAAGIAVGWTLNIIIYRLPKMMERDWENQCRELGDAEPLARDPLPLLPPRSCARCHKHMAPWQDTIPGYVTSLGKCFACGTLLSPRHRLVELAAGLAGAYAAWHFGFGTTAIAAMLFLWALITLSAIDFETFYLPDDIVLPLLWAGLLVNVSGLFVDLKSAVLGAAAGYLALWSLYWAYRLFKRASNKLTGREDPEEGMGYGDFKLLAAIGAWLGWKPLVLVVILSSVAGALIGIAGLIVAGRGRNEAMPFGPFLAGAGAIVLFGGAQINQSILGAF